MMMMMMMLVGGWWWWWCWRVSHVMCLQLLLQAHKIRRLQRRQHPKQVLQHLPGFFCYPFQLVLHLDNAIELKANVSSKPTRTQPCWSFPQTLLALSSFKVRTTLVIHGSNNLGLCNVRKSTTSFGHPEGPSNIHILDQIHLQGWIMGELSFKRAVCWIRTSSPMTDSESAMTHSVGYNVDT